MMATINLRLEISQEIASYLQEEARNRRISLDQVVSDVLTDYFAEQTEDEILEDIRIGMRQALIGEGRPAREVLAEVDREVTGDAHNR
ncbi:MAG: hypothetical protein OXG84_12050 [Chloroflexi bacterium]|nr:hypothetical protein [Chloroflexota bacterium]